MLGFQSIMALNLLIIGDFMEIDNKVFNIIVGILYSAIKLNKFDGGVEIE